MRAATFFFFLFSEECLCVMWVTAVVITLFIAVDGTAGFGFPLSTVRAVIANPIILSSVRDV
jgi:hypothetical protein